MKITNASLFAGSVLALSLLAGCKAGGENPGLEYAPQMYHAFVTNRYLKLKMKLRVLGFPHVKMGKGSISIPT